MTKTRTKPQFIILLLLVSFASVGAVLFTPALPSIQEFFGVSVGAAQFTITAYLMGYAVGQLPYGPLANRYGRKTTLYIGISLAIVGSLLCALSAPVHSFGLLVFARVVQALGACVGLKISFTMIADVCDQTEATKMISRNMIAFAVMPGLAVAVGGWITQTYNWESCFYFLSLFGVFILALTTLLPETAKSLDPHALKVSSILQGYAAKFKNQRILFSGLMMGFGSAVIYVFASKSPFIGISLIGLSPDVFGVFNLIPLVGMLSGAILAMQLAGRFPMLKVLLIGIVGSLLATFTMLIPFAMGIVNVWSLFLPVMLIYLAESLIFANVSSFGLSHAKNKSNGSAVLNFINLGTTVLAVLLSEFLYPESALVMPLLLVFFFVMTLLLWMRLKTLSTES